MAKSSTIPRSLTPIHTRSSSKYVLLLKFAIWVDPPLSYNSQLLCLSSDGNINLHCLQSGGVYVLFCIADQEQKKILVLFWHLLDLGIH